MNNLTPEGDQILNKGELPLEYFSLQYLFALKAQQISGIPLEHALLEYTSFWRRIGNKGWGFDTDIPSWKTLMQGISRGEIPAEAAYRLYLVSMENYVSKHNIHFGCFAFDFNPEHGRDKNIIKLHFKNRDSSGQGPLSSVRMQARLEELKAMFLYIKEHYPQSEVVHGASWLYNRKEYQRLFPQAYIEGILREEGVYPKTEGIWGQFLYSENGINSQMEERFLKSVESAATIEELMSAFVYKIKYPRASISEFYKFYEID